MAINVCTFEGRLTAEPMQRFTQSGKQVVDFDIAVPKRFIKEGGPKADFFRCEAWEKDAENIFKYFHQGDGIVVTGEMENNNYTNRDGQKIYGVVLKVRGWSFGPKKRGTEGGYSGSYTNDGNYSNYGGTVNDGGYNQSGYGQYPQAQPSVGPDGFMNIPEGLEEELPFS